MRDSSKSQILLATSDEDLVERLKGTGLGIVHVRDGFDAIRTAAESRLDAIVLDDSIYGLSRPDLALWLKLNPATTVIPLVGLDGDEGKGHEEELDARISRKDAVGRLASIVSALAERGVGWLEGDDDREPKAFDPLSVSLDLAGIYRDRLRVAKVVFDIARIQHNLADIHYTVRSILDASGRALGSELLALTLLRDRSLYILVKGNNMTKEHIDRLEFFNSVKLKEHLGEDVEIRKQWGFGRYRLAERTHGESPQCRFFGHPIIAGNETIGYLSAMYPSGELDHTSYAGLLPDLAAQIALLLVNADLIREQEQHAGEFTSVLRAVLETASISPLADISDKGFLLNLLLIVLDLCGTDRGCAVTLDKETGEVSETAAIGCHESEGLSASLRDWPSVQEAIPHLDPEQVVTDEVPDFRGRGGRLVVPLSSGEKIMGGLVALQLPTTLSPRIVESVKTLASLGGYFIYNRVLYEQSVRSSILEHQLDIARGIQRDMMPKTQPAIPGYSIFGRSEPAKEVGGDFFDYLPGKDGETTVAVADVSGKSIPASLLMAMSRAMVIAAMERSDGPDQVLKDVNAHLFRMITEGRFVTACLVTIDGDELICASAGQQPVMVYHADTDEFEQLEADGIAMGIVVEDIEFEKVIFQLRPGDVALMYTDGLNEAMNSRREQFGFDSVCNVVRQQAAGNAEEIVSALFQAMQDHAAGEEQSDDTTIVVIKRLSDGEIENGNHNQKQEE